MEMNFLCDKNITIPPNYDGPLPQCEGPKLYPFKDREADVNFVQLLSNKEDSDEPEGQSHVFEVTIASQPFALKMFKYYDVDEDYTDLTDKEKAVISKKLVCTHMDPFFNECRAFGRIIEKGLNGIVAVPCHGHLTVSAKLEDELKRRFDVEQWHRPEHEYKRRVSQRQPFRAIVKTLLPAGPSMKSNLVRQALKNLKKMRDLKVYAMDIRARNYISGTLIDLSNAITEEHYLFYINLPWRVRLYKKEDLEFFDGMIEELGIQTWWRALPQDRYRSKLRSGWKLREDKRLESAKRTWELIEQDEALQASNTAQSPENGVRAATAPEAKGTTRRKINVKDAASKTSNTDQGSKKKTGALRAKTNIASEPRGSKANKSAPKTQTANKKGGKKAEVVPTTLRRSTRLRQAR